MIILHFWKKRPVSRIAQEERQKTILLIIWQHVRIWGGIVSGVSELPKNGLQA